MTPKRPHAAPKARTAHKDSKAEQDRSIAERTLAWARRNALIAGAGVLVAIVGIVVVIAAIVHTQQGSTGPAGIAVNTAPRDPIDGAAIYPVPGGQPSDHVRAGLSLYVDCLQLAQPTHESVRISYGPYKNHWIDVFDIKTPTDGDVRYIKPPLPFCGPPVNVPGTPTSSQ